MDFAIVDLETTGLYPATDRVVEVGIVRMSADGRVLDEYSTLVNPERDVGPTSIHGITATDVMSAPRFADIVPDVYSMLHGAVPVAHNASFDFRFLRAEFQRAGVSPELIDGLCTLEVLYSVAPTAPRRLVDCCRHFGIDVGNAHTALDDARMAAQLLSRLISAWTFPALPSPLDCPGWTSTGRATRRGEVVDVRVEQGTYLTGLVRRLAAPSPGLISAASAGQYLNLLDRAIEDRLVTTAEADALADFARSVRLSSGEVAGLHAAYVTSLCSMALADGVVTDEERNDLGEVAALLGVEGWEEVLNAALAPSTPPVAEQSVLPPGTTVCFTGAMRVSRFDCETAAAQHGLAVLPGVSRHLKVLVVADANTQSGKAKKARDYGIRILSEAAFWNAIGGGAHLGPVATR